MGAAEQLYEEAMKLPPNERRALLRLLEQAEREPGEQAHPRTISWEEIDRGRSIVKLGGNALEDLDRLYDSG